MDYWEEAVELRVWRWDGGTGGGDGWLAEGRGKERRSEVMKGGVRRNDFTSRLVRFGSVREEADSLFFVMKWWWLWVVF